MNQSDLKPTNSADTQAFVTDAEGFILAASSSAAKLLGQSIHELLGTDLYSSRFTSLTKLNNTHLKKALQRKTPLSLEKDCDGKTYSICISPVLDKDEDVAQVLTFVRDITEERSTEAKLRESEKQSRAWLDYSPVCTKIVDLDYKLQYMSAAGLKSLKIEDPSSIYGQPYPLPFYPEDFKKLMLGKMDKVKRGEGVQELKASVVDVHGKELWFHSILVPIYNDTRAIDYMIIVSVDITETKQAEAKLRHSEKMNAIGKLAGGVAHDFNNHLTAILGYTELLIEELDDKDLKSHAERIKSATARSAEMTNTLLAFARKGDFKNLRANIHDTIDSVIGLLRPGLDKRVRVSRHLAAEKSVGRIDPTQLESAFLNLALNAKDAIAKDGQISFSTVTVTLDQDFCDATLFEITPGEYLRFDLRDNGCGMCEDTQRRMFEPFFTTKDVGRGTGLGLAGVYGAIERHKGAITVKSKPGEGSTFSVYLPVSDAAEPGEPQGISAENTPARIGAHILVVDDERDVRDVSSLSLGKAGYRVSTVKDGLEAVEFYRKAWKEIDLVLLDMSMPRMSGPDAFAEMQKTNPKVKALLCSGYDLFGKQKETMKDGFCGFLRKPYQREKLLQQVALALRDQS